MKVFVTGATGLVGAHAALELLKSGHEIVLLVRNQQLAENWFREKGYDQVHYVVGDMLNREIVFSGMSGCDAVVHSAAIVDLNAQNAEKTQSTNMSGLKNVCESAFEQGIQRIVYVSSLAAIFHTDLDKITEQAPLAKATDAYSKSKMECEEQVRKWQKAGQPIISIYPSGVFGPDDPKLAESNSAFIKFLNTIVPLTTSGIQCVDARDVALACRLLLEKELTSPEQERYLVAGNYIPWKEFGEKLEMATGRKLFKCPVPGWVFRALGCVMDFLRNFMVIEFPLSVEAATIVTLSPPADSSKVLDIPGMSFRPAEETFRDTTNDLVKRGLVKKA